MVISNERESLSKYLATAKAPELATFLAKARPLRRDMDTFLARENGIGINEIIERLKSGKRSDIHSARDSIDSYLDHRAAKMPMDHLPMSVRREFSATDGKENFKKIPESLAEAGRLLKEKKPLRAYFKATNAIAEGIAGTMDFFIPLKKSERTLALLTGASMSITLPFVASAQAAISQNDIHGALNDFNTSPHTDTISGSTSSPLKIIIDGASVQGHFNGAAPLNNEENYLYSPYLVQKLETSSQAKQYIQWINDEAAKNNINPVILGNQLFRETVHFNPKYIYGPDMSPANAMGMGQFTKSTGARYGLFSKEDFFNPQKSIAAAATHMRDLLDDYNQDYALALAAYNGGPGSVDFVRQQLGRNITGKEWVAFMDARHESSAVKTGSAWHVETREYVSDILNENWDRDYKKWAIELQGTDAIAFATTGKKTIVAPMPTPLALRPQSHPSHNNG